MHTDLIGMPVYTQDYKLGVIRLVTSNLQVVVQLKDKFEEHCILDLAPALDRPISMEAAVALNSSTKQQRAPSYIMRIWSEMLEKYKEGDNIKYRYAMKVQELQDEANADR